MSLYGEFTVPAEAFALYRTLQATPDVVIEIERVAATEEVLTPYFWASGEDRETVAEAIENDPSVEGLTELDEFEEATLYRASWTENIESIVYAYTQVEATILEASGHRDRWELRMRFDDRERLEQFQSHCAAADIPFQLTQLHELSQPRTGSQFELTPKQHEALVTTWELGYYGRSDVTLTDVAAELGISQQSVSQRLNRGYEKLIGNTLVVTPPSAGEE
ncbi:helix-turn-helix domain-containing protein [Natronobiforma cellulositropha]|uniref:helix-turn-helix domain-containing protein n=1 Tax=Natronobiforma cellulositropha TaxID=1679076 RepID=UPI0021D59F58|nr:bacterio-opsin activator domain-containing protein [Natronobiforma cellulositropha]